MSLYRKYRSPDFSELVGQEPVVKTLKNAIATGRIAHAYLFTGPRGVGKTSAARLLARAANCLSDGPDKPCNKCANCLAAGRETITDLIEIDAASNTGVDNIRELIERANFAPSVWHTKFYIIDEVHMLSVSAFNALLKTLEEPPPQVAFILATTEVHKVPATVASRCQRFDFRKIPLATMTARLRFVCEQEGIEAETGALDLVSRQATGSLRDALSLLDQLRVFAEGPITVGAVQDMLGASGVEQVADFVDALVAGDLASGLKQINAVLDEGLDPRQLNKQIVEHLRGLMLIKSGAASADGMLLDVTAEMQERMASQASQASMADLLRWVKAFAEADAAIRSSAYRQLPLEMALIAALLKVDDVGHVQGRPAELAPVQGPGVIPPRLRPAQQAQPDAPPPFSNSAPPPIQQSLGMPGQNGKSPQQTPAPAVPDGEQRAELPVPPAFEEEPPLEEPVLAASADGRSNGAVYRVEPPDEQTAVPAEGEGSDFDKLRQRWPRLVEQINARSKAMASAFRNPDLVRPFNVVGNRVTVSFRDPIQAKRSQGEPQRSIIEESLSRVLERPCVLDSILYSEEGIGGSATEPFRGEVSPRNAVKEKKPSPYESSRGRAAMNIFGITKFEEE